AEQLGSLGGELTRLVPQLPRLVPGLADPLRAEPETERYRLFEAVAELLGAVSRAAPVLLVLDDLHWADKATFALLRHAVRSPESPRLLVVATYRDTEIDNGRLADLCREPGVERMPVSGLDEEEVSALVEVAAGHDLDDNGR